MSLYLHEAVVAGYIARRQQLENRTRRLQRHIKIRRAVQCQYVAFTRAFVLTHVSGTLLLHPLAEIRQRHQRFLILLVCRTTDWGLGAEKTCGWCGMVSSATPTTISAQLRSDGGWREGGRAHGESLDGRGPLPNLVMQKLLLAAGHWGASWREEGRAHPLD